MLARMLMFGCWMWALVIVTASALAQSPEGPAPTSGVIVVDTGIAAWHLLAHADQLLPGRFRTESVPGGVIHVWCNESVTPDGFEDLLVSGLRGLGHGLAVGEDSTYVVTPSPEPNAEVVVLCPEDGVDWEEQMGAVRERMPEPGGLTKVYRDGDVVVVVGSWADASALVEGTGTTIILVIRGDGSGFTPNSGFRSDAWKEREHQELLEILRESDESDNTYEPPWERLDAPPSTSGSPENVDHTRSD